MTPPRKIANLASVRRLPSYIRVLQHFKEEGWDVVSTTHLAEYLDMDAITVRKDIATTGIAGKPGLGYQVDELLAAIEEFLGWHNATDAFIVGMGNLGRALKDYEGLKRHGLNIVAGFDTDLEKVDPEAKPMPIYPMSRLKPLAQRLKVSVAILTVPAAAAQVAADALVEAGIRAIWSFSPAEIRTPPDVIVQREDMSVGFAVLSRKMGLMRRKDSGLHS